MRAERSFADEIIAGVAAFFRPRLVVVRTPAPAPRLPEHPVIAVLKRAGKPLTNQQLAAAMGVSEGQSTKLRRKVRENLIEWRKGRYVFVTLAEFPGMEKVSKRKLRGK